jgi:hypothetical protein
VRVIRSFCSWLIMAAILLKPTGYDFCSAIERMVKL